MTHSKLLRELNKTEKQIQINRKTHSALKQKMSDLCDQLCESLKPDDLRPMTKNDIAVGQRIFGQNSNGFFTLVIEEVLGNDDLDFKAFTAEGCRYGIFENYVLKNE